MSPTDRKLVAKTVAITLLVLALGGAAGAYAFMMSGIYNISSTSQHLQFVYTFLEKGMHQSVRFHARKIEAPPLDDVQMVQRGARIYDAVCVQCHGAPGIAPQGIGMGMQPVPGPLVDSDKKWEARELYWIVRHGIKMSGMPAWEYRMSDEQLWEMVAFMQHLPQMTPAEYRNISRSNHGTHLPGTTEEGVQP